MVEMDPELGEEDKRIFHLREMKKKEKKGKITLPMNGLMSQFPLVIYQEQHQVLVVMKVEVEVVIDKKIVVVSM